MKSKIIIKKTPKYKVIIKKPIKKSKFSRYA